LGTITLTVGAPLSDLESMLDITGIHDDDHRNDEVARASPPGIDFIARIRFSKKPA